MLDHRTRSVLIVEDEALIAMGLQRQLEAQGYRVVGIVAHGEDVIAEVQKHRPTVVLMDIRLKGNLDGVLVGEEVFVCEDVPVVFLSAFGDPGIYERAARAGAYGYLTKPVTMAALVTTLEMAVQKHADLRARREDAQWLGVAINAVERPIIGLDVEGKVRFMNHAAWKLTGWRLMEAKGDPPPWARQLAALVAAGAAGDRSLVPLVLVTRAGQAVDVKVRIFPITTGGSVSMFEDP